MVPVDMFLYKDIRSMCLHNIYIHACIVLHTHFRQRITEKNIYDISLLIADWLRLKIVPTPILEHIPDFPVPNWRKQKRDSLQLIFGLGDYLQVRFFI